MILLYKFTRFVSNRTLFWLAYRITSVILPSFLRKIPEVTLFCPAAATYKLFGPQSLIGGTIALGGSQPAPKVCDYRSLVWAGFGFPTEIQNGQACGLKKTVQMPVNRRSALSFTLY